MYKGQVPWECNPATGKESPLSYPSWACPKPGTTAIQYDIQYFWRDNTPFTDVLVVDSFSRGRSAANINAKSKTTGIVYTFFMSDFLEVVKDCTIVKGEIEERKWLFVKKGANFGLALCV